MAVGVVLDLSQRSQMRHVAQPNPLLAASETTLNVLATNAECDLAVGSERG
jgi:hypothetical protein